MPINILMPALSPTMTEGNLAKWHVKEGDQVESGDVVAEIETDKATMEVEAVDEGVIGKILIDEGVQNVAVNTPIAVLLEDGESADDIGKITENNVVTNETTPSKPPEQDAITSQKQAEKPSVNLEEKPKNRIFASPLARRIAKDKGVDLSTVSGSGPRGRIVKSDLEGSAGTSQSEDHMGDTAHTSTSNDVTKMLDVLGIAYEAVPNNNIKKVTARRLLESKQTVPHFYLTIECQIDDLLSTRKEINEKADGAYKLSVNDFIVKACAMALKAYPAANVAWTEEATLQFQQADISVAVATDNGLITPIVKNAEDKGLAAISTEIKDLAGRAREGKLKPEEFQGGSFTVSNLGMFGIDEFSAIINPPQSCILAVGAGQQKPYVAEGEIKIGNFMKCTLSTDHRTVDGAVGAEFLQVLKKYIEYPVNMLV